MDEVIKLVSDKTGISPDAARTAVETVVGFLKNKLPAPISGQLDSILKGGGVSEEKGTDDLSAAKDKLGL